MGLNKRYIKKEMILGNVDNISNISEFTKTDALIMDTWSNNFFDNFDFKWKTYNSLREKLNEDVIFYSHHDPTLEHENYPKLKKLSNVLINLKTNPLWVDILLAGELLKVGVPINIIGKFQLLIDYYIYQIEKYYDN